MRISKKLLSQCYKALVRAFDLSLHVAMNPACSPMGLENSLGRYCDHLDLSARVHSVCSDIIVAARKHGIAVGRSPVSIAGGAIYFTCHLLGEVKLVQDICAVVGVSEGTLKLINQLFQENKAKLVKQEWVDEVGEAAAPPFEST
jgi:transcription initiation factor TFIIB